jgi:transcriptional regulator with GAF, ATPase, and Fis domain
MPKNRAGGEEIVEHFDSLPKAAGSAEERVAATAKYFKVKSATVEKHLKFWWPGKKYLKEFEREERIRVRWDRPTNDLMEAMNRHGSVAKAAKALKTTPVTLAKALQRHQIEQRWVLAMPTSDRSAK